MGFRFRRSFKIAPGIRVNLNSKSTSVRIGPKGLGYTFSSNGKKRVTASIPGTGISYSEVVSPARRQPAVPVQSLQSSGVQRKANLWPWIIGLIGIVIAFNVFGNAGSGANRNAAAVPAPPPPTATALPTFSSPTSTARPSLAPSPPGVEVAPEVRFVTASSLNIRSAPNTSGDIVAKASTGHEISVLEHGEGWLLVQTAAGLRGWVSEQYTSKERPAPVISRPVPLMQTNTAQSSGLSCSPRRTCSQISSCFAARWYLANCSWGGRLDRDNDGRPCEAMC